MARVVTEGGAALGPRLFLFRVDPERLDPHFLAGFLRIAQVQRRLARSLSPGRTDVRRVPIPRLPLDEQRAYGEAFRRLARSRTPCGRRRLRGETLVRLGFAGLADGSLHHDRAPNNLPILGTRRTGGAVSARMLINGRYELEDLPIARGGMGEVWVGRDIKLEREIAVKFIRFPDGNTRQELVRRFVRESRITARLEHPGVPAVYDVGTHDDRPYLVMQRIRGISVADLIAEHGPLPIGWAAGDRRADLRGALSRPPGSRSIHRDLKPSNLMLERDGSVKVLDFGLAVALDLPDFSRITRTGQSFGTPAYMAPEQIWASMSGPQTDLYALGCTLHEMLTGQPLFAGSTAYAVMSKQVDERPRSVRSLRSEVPAELATAAARAVGEEA